MTVYIYDTHMRTLSFHLLEDIAGIVATPKESDSVAHCGRHRTDAITPAGGADMALIHVAISLATPLCPPPTAASFINV